LNRKYDEGRQLPYSGWVDVMRFGIARKLVADCRCFAEETEAATATEYAVMLALIIGAMITAISALGQRVSSMFAQVVGAPW
jgi:Flp pilus assembly pilin Flp